MTECIANSSDGAGDNVLSTAADLEVRFSVTVRRPAGQANPGGNGAIREAAWTLLPSWVSTPEVAGADVAQTSHTACAGEGARPDGASS